MNDNAYKYGNGVIKISNNFEYKYVKKYSEKFYNDAIFKHINVLRLKNYMK